MVEYEITVEVPKKLEYLPEKSKEISKKAVTLTSHELIRNLKIKTPVDQGAARSGWWKQSLGDDGVQVYNNENYIIFLDQGTGLYGPYKTPITPKKKKVLHWSKGGKDFFAKSVKGIQPRKIVEKSIKPTKRRVPQFVQMAVRSVGL